MTEWLSCGQSVSNPPRAPPRCDEPGAGCGQLGYLDVHREALGVDGEVGREACCRDPAQRFGSAFSLNIHLHMLYVDGAYELARRSVRFRRMRPLTALEFDRLLVSIAQRAARSLER